MKTTRAFVGSLTVVLTSMSRSRSSRSRRILVSLLILLTAWTLAAGIAARLLVRSVPLKHADALIVLSGSRAYRERTAYAASLYREGVAPLVVLTNDGEQASWSNVEERNPPFQELAATELQKQGVPREAIRLLPDLVQGTRDEADVVSRFAQTEKLQSLLLVTSDYHSRRAFSTFEKATNAHQMTLGVQSPSTSFGKRFFWWVRYQGWKTTGAEFIKTVYYW